MKEYLLRVIRTIDDYIDADKYPHVRDKFARTSTKPAIFSSVK